MSLPFSVKGKLTPEEAIGFRRDQVRFSYPLHVRCLIALLTGGIGVWNAWVSHLEGLSMAPAYAGIVLCALVPFALVWLHRAFTIVRFRIFRPDLPESSVTIDSDGVEIALVDETARWKWKLTRAVVSSPTGLMFFLGWTPVLLLPNRVFGGTDKADILAAAAAGSTSVIQLS